MCIDCGREIVLEIERCPFCNYSLRAEAVPNEASLIRRPQLGIGQMIMVIVGFFGGVVGIIWVVCWLLLPKT
jgi:hypothetical protein